MVDQILGDLQYDARQTTYTVGSMAQGLRQAASLARVLAYPFISQEPSFSCIASLIQNGPWLMDTWLDLRHVQRRWDLAVPSSPIPLIETALDVAKCPMMNSDSTISMKNKSYTILVLLCSEIISSPDELLRVGPEGERARLVYCKALIAISEASLQSYAVGRLAASKLVQELAFLSPQHPTLGEGTDIWVNATPLRFFLQLTGNRGA